MADLRLHAALLCIRDYKFAFEELRKVFELRVSKDSGDCVDIVPCRNPSPHPKSKSISCVDLSVHSSTEDEELIRKAARAQYLDEEVVTLRNELDASTCRLWSERENFTTEILRLKQSLSATSIDRSRLEDIVNHMTEHQQRSPQPAPRISEEMIQLQSSLSEYKKTISELQCTIGTLEESNSRLRMKYDKLKSKYRGLTGKLKVSLVDHITTATSNASTRSVSLLHLYLLSLVPHFESHTLVLCFQYRYPVIAEK